MTIEGRHKSTQERHGLAVAGAGVASGLIGSLAISALMLLAERVAGLPIGSFYLMLVSAISQAQDYNIRAIALGLILHILAGSLMGLIISTPFAISRKAYTSLGKFAPAFGLLAGALVWAALFLPVTYWTMLPLLQSLDGQSVVSQRAPIGTLFSIAVSDMLAITDRIVYAGLVFNMLFGLVSLVLTRALSEAAISR